MSRGQLNLLDEIIVDNFAAGGRASTGIELATALVRANLPEWYGEEITTMAQLEKAVAA